MRFVIARMNHETNSFSPVPTPLDAFAPRWADEARAAGEGSRTAMGAFIDFAKARGADIVTPVFAIANPSGPVSDAAYEKMTKPIVDAVAAGCDAVLLDLHGAMVTESIGDGEGELLERVRRAAPDVPVGVALDLHGNISQKMLDNADMLVGFKTYPHIDIYETGEQVARIMAGFLDKKIAVNTVLAHPPILAQTLKMNTTVAGAMRDAIDMAREAETREGVHAVTVFGGFPLSDLAETGVSVLVVAETEALAEEVAEDMGAAIWRMRDGFVYHERPLAESVADARTAADKPGDGPILMLDHGDNCMSGGTCDTMDVLAEAMRQGLKAIVAGPIADPAAVEAMHRAGVGASITVGIGNCRALPKIGIDKPPLELKGTVKAVGRGDYVITGPTYTGMRCDMGDAAVIETDSALVLVVDKPHEPWDFGVFTCLGLDPAEARFLILKSRMYCRPVFEPIAKSVVECASLGVTSSNFDLFAFEKLARPIFPLDAVPSWDPRAHIS